MRKRISPSGEPGGPPGTDVLLGKLFIAALGQMYEQHYGKKYQ